MVKKVVCTFAGSNFYKVGQEYEVHDGKVTGSDGISDTLTRMVSKFRPKEEVVTK
jgi:hypothetical protein